MSFNRDRLIKRYGVLCDGLTVQNVPAGEAMEHTYFKAIFAA